MRRSSRPCHDAFYAATVVEWLASWTVSSFDAMAKVNVMAVVRDEEAGADAFAAALETCRVQTLGVLNQRLARWARQMEGLMNAFPGAPEVTVTRRLSERLAEWLVQACAWDRAEEQRAPGDGTTVHAPGEDGAT